jgi:hypothetical protein
MTSMVTSLRGAGTVLLLAAFCACASRDDANNGQASQLSAEEQQESAKTIFQRLTGTGLLESDPRFGQMVAAIANGQPGDAARIATADPNFYRVILRNWSAPWSSVEGAIDNELDDMQALALGLVRDDADARLLLTANFHYEGSTTGVPAVAAANNDHFKALEDRFVDLGTALVKKDGAGISSPEYAGVLTTRGFAKAYYFDGTNRRAVVFAMKNMLCTPQSSWRDPNLPENFIRRDVHRDPPSNYQAECRTCHAPMDAMSGAFAHFDFADGQAKYFGPFNVAPKYNINTTVFPDGYAPADDSWINYATQHQNVALGWTGPLQGRGIKAYSQMLANSGAFASCMVKTAFEATCRRPADAEDATFLNQTKNDFVAGGYHLRSLFEKIAVSDQCP